MKEKIIEFLFKRMGTKVDQITSTMDNISNKSPLELSERIGEHLYDLDDYIKATHAIVKEIIKESLLP